MKQLTFFEDGGHGWLQVPENHIKELGIENDVTPFSYHYSGMIYLEEDCDLTTYCSARFNQGLDSKMYQSYHESKNVYAGDYAVIRQYPHYKNPTYKFAYEEAQ